MTERPDDICPQIETPPPQTTIPAAPPIYPASVHVVDDTNQAQALLEGTQTGYVYQRHGHPNADMFAEKCRRLHGAECVAVASSGMAAMALALLSQLQQGDHVVASNQLYGHSSHLITEEASRLGIDCTEVDPCDLSATADAFKSNTKMLVVETIANPMLRVVDISALAELCHSHKAKLLVDNTFATPVFCQPLGLGADFALESVSKMMNGHSDVMLGILCGRECDWERVPPVLSAWGLASNPMDCWLASRGLATLSLRVRKAAENALAVAEFLTTCDAVQRVDYPGLTSHPDHKLASRQLSGGFGTVVTFHLPDDRTTADAFIKSAPRIPFCPSLGEVCTTLSHPTSTSHRDLSSEQRIQLGISDGTIRLSVGIESTEFIRNALREGLGV